MLETMQQEEEPAPRQSQSGSVAAKQFQQVQNFIQNRQQYLSALTNLGAANSTKDNTQNLNQQAKQSNEPTQINLQSRNQVIKSKVNLQNHSPSQQLQPQAQSQYNETSFESPFQVHQQIQQQMPFTNIQYNSGYNTPKPQVQYVPFNPYCNEFTENLKIYYQNSDRGTVNLPISYSSTSLFENAKQNQYGPPYTQQPVQVYSRPKSTRGYQSNQVQKNLCSNFNNTVSQVKQDAHRNQESVQKQKMRRQSVFHTQREFDDYFGQNQSQCFQGTQDSEPNLEWQKKYQNEQLREHSIVYANGQGQQQNYQTVQNNQQQMVQKAVSDNKIQEIQQNGDLGEKQRARQMSLLDLQQGYDILQYQLLKNQAQLEAQKIKKQGKMQQSQVSKEKAKTQKYRRQSAIGLQNGYDASQELLRNSQFKRRQEISNQIMKESVIARDFAALHQQYKDTFQGKNKRHVYQHQWDSNSKSNYNMESSNSCIIVENNSHVYRNTEGLKYCSHSKKNGSDSQNNDGIEDVQNLSAEQYFKRYSLRTSDQKQFQNMDHGNRQSTVGDQVRRSQSPLQKISQSNSQNANTSYYNNQQSPNDVPQLKLNARQSGVGTSYQQQTQREFQKMYEEIELSKNYQLPDFYDNDRESISTKLMPQQSYQYFDRNDNVLQESQYQNLQYSSSMHNLGQQEDSKLYDNQYQSNNQYQYSQQYYQQLEQQQNMQYQNANYAESAVSPQQQQQQQSFETVSDQVENRDPHNNLTSNKEQVSESQLTKQSSDPNQSKIFWGEKEGEGEGIGQLPNINQTTPNNKKWAPRFSQFDMGVRGPSNTNQSLCADVLLESPSGKSDRNFY